MSSKLLMLFELETAVIDDDKLKGNLKWLFTGIRAICYFFITYAFYGYCVKYGLVSNLVPFTVSDACQMIGSEYTLIADLDEYLPIAQANCGLLNNADLVRIEGTTIVGTAEAARAAINLAIVDIVNAGDWLIIVVLLEV